MRFRYYEAAHSSIKLHLSTQPFTCDNRSFIHYFEFIKLKYPFHNAPTVARYGILAVDGTNEKFIALAIGQKMHPLINAFGAFVRTPVSMSLLPFPSIIPKAVNSATKYGGNTTN